MHSDAKNMFKLTTLLLEWLELEGHEVSADAHVSSSVDIIIK